ncbi:carbon storage regulator [Isosphaeraceae bacterium EP7]
MLVLSRKRSERILIGDDIRIIVVKLDKNQVRLGIEAPQGISIIREELLGDVEDLEARKAWRESVTLTGSGS